MKKKSKAGRKSKLQRVVEVGEVPKARNGTELNKDLLDRICTVLRIGSSPATAAALAGISDKTFKAWIIRGKEDPKSIFGKFHKEVLKSIAECEVRALATIDAHVMGRPAEYEMEAVRDKNGDVIIMSGKPLMQVARDKKGEPIVKKPAIVADPQIALKLLERRFPKTWGAKYHHHLIGSDEILDAEPPKETQDENIIEVPTKKTFEEFCEKAGYPAPFPKQIEMMEFMIFGDEIRMLLGSRGYGKTDYGPALGVAYAIYLDPANDKTLLVSKSSEKNAAILKEVAKALEANGVPLIIDRATAVRAIDCKGKDHSLSAITMGSASFRGKHPTRILLDDPVTPEDDSAAVRRRAMRLFDEIVKLKANACVIGQPVHKHDLYAHLRATEIDIMEVPHGTIPELDADLDAQRIAGVSEESIKASYFLEVPQEGVTPFDSINYSDEFPGNDAVAFIDPSFKGGDYTAMTLATSHFDGLAIQGHVWKKAWNHCLEDMATIMQKNGVRRVAFETNSLGDQPVIMLRQIFSGSGVGIVPWESKENKHARIMNAGAYAHLLHLSRKSDKEYIKQVTQYEYGAEYDDAPDSLASTLYWLGLIRGKRKR